MTHDSIGLGRGRSDPPADRAPRGPAGDPGPAGVPSGRRRRGRRCVALRARARRPVGHRPVPPGAAAPRRQAGRRGRPRRLRACATPAWPRRRPGRDPARHRLRGARCASRRPSVLAGRRASACRVVSVPSAGSGSRRSTRPTATRCCRRRSGPASRSRRPTTFGWERYVGDAGAVVGMERFGASAPAEKLFETFGFTADNVAAVARDVLGRVEA